MKRISEALYDSSYSIHDLTRAHGDPATGNLARFNMPFEFGMAFLLAEIASTLGIGHDWIALLPDSHPYGEFISDLAGYDLESHDGTPNSVIPPVLAWLSTRPGVPPLPPAVSPAALIALMPEFERLVESEDLKWAGSLPWARIIGIARDLVASRLP